MQNLFVAYAGDRAGVVYRSVGLHFAPLEEEPQKALDFQIEVQAQNRIGYDMEPEEITMESRHWWSEQIAYGKYKWGSWGPSVVVAPHWCPGYYDCLRCYPD